MTTIIIVALLVTHLTVAIWAYQRGTTDQHRAETDMRAAERDELAARRLAHTRAAHPSVTVERTSPYSRITSADVERAIANVVPFRTPDQAS